MQNYNASGKTSTGLEANIAALLSYILTWITGLIFFLIEKDNRFVRFHAMQSILFGVAVAVILIALNILISLFAVVHLGILSILVGFVQLIICIIFFVVWVLCLIKAYQGQWFKLPVIGNMAENIVNK